MVDLVLVIICLRTIHSQFIQAIHPTKLNHTTFSDRIMKNTRNKFISVRWQWADSAHGQNENKTQLLNWNVQLWTQQFNIHLAFRIFCSYKLAAKLAHYTFIIQTAVTVCCRPFSALNLLKCSYRIYEMKQSNKYTKYKYVINNTVLTVADVVIAAAAAAAVAFFHISYVGLMSHFIWFVVCAPIDFYDMYDLGDFGRAWKHIYFIRWIIYYNIFIFFFYS